MQITKSPNGDADERTAPMDHNASGRALMFSRSDDGQCTASILALGIERKSLGLVERENGSYLPCQTTPSFDTVMASYAAVAV